MYPNKAKISEQNLLNSQAMYSTELIIEDLFRYTEKRRIYFFYYKRADCESIHKETVKLAKKKKN